MIAVLRHQQMCERARRGTAARGRHRRRRGLRDGIARGAGIFRPDVTDDLEVPGHIIQHLGHVLAELGHSPAAIRTGACTVISRLMHDLLPRQMIGQRPALWLATLADRCCGFGGLNLGFGAGGVFGHAGFQFLEPELKLGNLAIDPLRGPAELHAAQLGDLELELFDLQCLVLHRKFGRLQFALTGQRECAQRDQIGGKFGRGERHV